MIPVAFSGMLGKLHLPQAESKGLGVVIVPPHGVEALAATKSLRLLAEGFAAAGLPALRFDLPGTADSLGTDADPDRLQAWIEGTRQAAEALKAHAGVTGVVAAGLRFGAHLAALAAGGIDGLAGLVLLDPVVRGRAYARELAVTARAVAEGARLDPQATATGEGILVGGHLTSEETLAAIRALDLGKAAPPAAPILILHRRGAADAVALAAAWGASATVSIREAEGFESISLSPTMAATPHAAFGLATAWAADLPAPPRAPAVPPPPAILAGEGFTEEAMTFGEDGRLFGVLCRPARRVPGKPALLVVNAGRNPHIGWARSSVDLARRLAAEGVASLRVDLGGIGDGADRPGAPDTIESVLYHEAIEAEAAAAIDLLAARCPGPIVLSGACSGAYLAFRAAARDPRVVGLVLVNIQRFAWRRGETVAEAIASAYPLAKSYISRAWDPMAWRRALRGERSLAPILAELARRSGRRLRALVPLPETRAARAMMATLLARGVRIELFFSADDPGLEDLALHFGRRGRRLAGRPGVTLTLVPDADHDLTPPAARRVLLERTLAVIAAAAPAPGGMGSA